MFNFSRTKNVNTNIVFTSEEESNFIPLTKKEYFYALSVVVVIHIISFLIVWITRIYFSITYNIFFPVGITVILIALYILFCLLIKKIPITKINFIPIYNLDIFKKSAIFASFVFIPYIAASYSAYSMSDLNKIFFYSNIGNLLANFTFFYIFSVFLSFYFWNLGLFLFKNKLNSKNNQLEMGNYTNQLIVISIISLLLNQGFVTPEEDFYTINENSNVLSCKTETYKLLGEYDDAYLIYDKGLSYKDKKEIFLTSNRCVIHNEEKLKLLSVEERMNKFINKINTGNYNYASIIINNKYSNFNSEEWSEFIKLVDLKLKSIEGEELATGRSTSVGIGDNSQPSFDKLRQDCLRIIYNSSMIQSIPVIFSPGDFKIIKDSLTNRYTIVEQD